MKICVIDIQWIDQSFFGAASLWIIREIKKTNHSIVEPEYADYCLVSIASDFFYRKLKTLKKTLKDDCIIIAGGGASYRPAYADNIIDYFCVGEGFNFINVFLDSGVDGIKTLPNCYFAGKTKKTIPDYDFKYSDFPITNDTTGVSKIVVARGCRYKCRFCQTSWECQFNTHDELNLLEKQVNFLRRKNKRYSFVSNDALDLPEVFFEGMSYLSTRFDTIKKMMPMDRKTVKSLRIGVEGISERIRKAISKPISNNELIELTLSLQDSGIKVRWSMICGFPYEDESDWAEFRETYLKFKKKSKKDILFIMLHALQWMPATPLSIFPINDDYYDNLIEFEKFRNFGTNYTSRVRIVKPKMPENRNKDSLLSMGCTVDDLYSGFENGINPNSDIIQYPYQNKVISNAGLYKKIMCEGENGK